MSGLPNFSQFVNPGVYWSQTAAAAIGVVGGQPTVVALVGPGIGYRTFSDTLTLTSTTAQSLSQFGISTASIVVTSTDGSITYVATTDYTITTTASSDGNALDTTNTIVRVGAGAITSRETVVVSYQYTDSTYYMPVLVNNYPTVEALFGAAINSTTGAILSPLALAAQFAFSNGANSLVLVACQTSSGTTTTRSYLQAAYTKLAAVDTVDIVVPLPVGLTGTSIAPGDIINIGQDLDAFVNTQSNNSLFQIGIIGYETTETVTPDAIAAAIDDQRTIEAWPNQLSYYNGFVNATQTISGYYLAAAIAGIFAKNPVQQGLTKQIVNGFSGIPPLVFATMTIAYKNQLSAAGVCVAEIVNGGTLQLRYGTTTQPDTVYTREASLVRSQDFMINSLVQTITNAGLIGTPITENTSAIITGLTTGGLNFMVKQGVINAFSGVSCTIQSENPTIEQVTFAYKPSYPLNFVTIAFSIDTSTGALVNSSTLASSVG